MTPNFMSNQSDSSLLKVQELNVVKIEGPQKRSKQVISRMTCVNPEERLSAGRVLYILHNRESVDADEKV